MQARKRGTVPAPPDQKPSAESHSGAGAARGHETSSEKDFRRRRDAARRGKDPDDYAPKEARAGDPEREGPRRGGR